MITAPRISSAITGGSGIITGNFNAQEASDLAVLLRAGALPAPLEIVEERSVGAGLGADSIAAGQIAAIIGMVLVCVFMILTCIFSTIFKHYQFLFSGKIWIFFIHLIILI